MIEKTKSVLLIIALGYILFVQMCNRSSPCPTVMKTVRVDTFWKESADSSGWKHIVPATVRVPGKTDTLYLPEAIYISDPADTQAIISNYLAMQKDYFTQRYYQDTTAVEYGSVITKDTVYRNRIIAHKVVTNFNLPVITKEITVSEKPRIQFYSGFGLFGSQRYLLEGGEITLAIKTKRDQMYEIGGVLISDHWAVKAGTKFRLSFRK